MLQTIYLHFLFQFFLSIYRCCFFTSANICGENDRPALQGVPRRTASFDIRKTTRLVCSENWPK